jgi:hypothetical protein
LQPIKKIFRTFFIGAEPLAKNGKNAGKIGPFGGGADFEGTGRMKSKEDIWNCQGCQNRYEEKKGQKLKRRRSQ